MFSERLKELRKERKISQTVLASRLSLSQQAIAKWETGHATPDPQTLRRIADLLYVSTDDLLGRVDPGSVAADEVYLPVFGEVRADCGALSCAEKCGSEPASVKNPTAYFYLIVSGDSMEPRIHSGDLALVHRQSDVENGELAVVLLRGEEGTLKRIHKKSDTVVLQPFNPAYQPQILVGAEVDELVILGKVVETKTKW